MEPDAHAVKRDVAAALLEDVGDGDINAALISPQTRAAARIATRVAGVLCGRAWAEEACRQTEPAIALRWRVAEGGVMAAGDVVVDLSGPARGLLTVERTAVNFLQLLSATATRARRYVDAVRGTGAIILDTRKTVPGLRAAQKYAVRVGGARNHRAGLFDGFLLKENHIAAAGGIAPAAARAREAQERQAEPTPVQVEVENNEQLAEAIAAGADSVLLDNYDLPRLRAAVALTKGRVPLEASGSVGLANVRAIAETGVDRISVGDITKNVAPLDFSMRIVSVCGAGDGARAD